MKKLILLITVFTLISCKKEVIYKEVYKPTTDNTTIYINGVEYILTIASDGHDYIDNKGFHDYMCMHYIDCRKCADKNLKTK